MAVNGVLLERHGRQLGQELAGQTRPHHEPQCLGGNVDHHHLVEFIADSLGRDDGEAAVHALDGGDESGIGVSENAPRTGPRAASAAGRLRTDLRVERCAQSTGGQVTETVERIDQLHLGQPERQSIDREVPAGQVHFDVVAETHVGLARLGSYTSARCVVIS